MTSTSVPTLVPGEIPPLKRRFGNFEEAWSTLRGSSFFRNREFEIGVWHASIGLWSIDWSMNLETDVKELPCKEVHSAKHKTFTLISHERHLLTDREVEYSPESDIHRVSGRFGRSSERRAAQRPQERLIWFWKTWCQTASAIRSSRPVIRSELTYRWHRLVYKLNCCS